MDFNNFKGAAFGPYVQGQKHVKLDILNLTLYTQDLSIVSSLVWS